jgi:hypothetical protein
MALQQTDRIRLFVAEVRSNPAAEFSLDLHFS